MIATARILMPKSKIRLSAGREKPSKEPKFYVFNVGQIQFFMEMSYSQLQINLSNRIENFLKRLEYHLTKILKLVKKHYLLYEKQKL